MPNTQFWSMESAADGSTDLYILDEIAHYESWWFDTVTPKMFQEQLNQVHGSLTVWIDSPGGDAFAGAAIYGMLRDYSASGRGKVTAKITGLAASAASLIAMAADDVRISVAGTIMIHDPWCSLQGNSEELRRNADVLDEIREGQIAAYMQKTGMSHDDILNLMQGEGTYMNSSTAIGYHFADGLMGDAGVTTKSATKVRVQSCANHQREYWSGKRASFRWTPDPQPEDSEEPSKETLEEIKSIRFQDTTKSIEAMLKSYKSDFVVRSKASLDSVIELCGDVFADGTPEQIAKMKAAARSALKNYLDALSLGSKDTDDDDQDDDDSDDPNKPDTDDPGTDDDPNDPDDDKKKKAAAEREAQMRALLRVCLS